MTFNHFFCGKYCYDNELNEILILSGQRKLSIISQIHYGVCAGIQYIICAIITLFFAVYLHLSVGGSFPLLIGGIIISLLGLLYGISVSPSGGSTAAVRNFIERSNKNHISSKIIIQQAMHTLNTIDKQIITLNKVYRFISIFIFIVGLLCSLLF